MAEWVNVAVANDFPSGTHVVVDVNDVQIAVFNVEGKFYAIEDVCTHDGGILTGGPVSGCIITCPRHGATFDIRNGAALSAPAYEPTASFPIRVESGIVQVKDDRWD
ncbi:MAG TPA: non-heme iron oxygenase ferredoxin subunit [Gammaproteobacteria bacterium]|jgi:3-phenylpropionate/trans-cinnamate dioxygenase ferredoxin subunit